MGDLGLTLAGFKKMVEDLSLGDFISLVQSLGMTLQGFRLVHYIFLSL